jgi:hypothetical protein
MLGMVMVILGLYAILWEQGNQFILERASIWGKCSATAI